MIIKYICKKKLNINMYSDVKFSLRIERCPAKNFPKRFSLVGKRDTNKKILEIKRSILSKRMSNKFYQRVIKVGHINRKPLCSPQFSFAGCMHAFSSFLMQT